MKQPFFTLLDWFHDHPYILIACGILSIATLFGTALLLPLMIGHLPDDYFLKNKIGKHSIDNHPIMKWAFKIGKNLLGLLLIVAGLAMLVLPGQGLLTIFAGLILADFPGKRKLERFLIGKKSVLRAINYIRQKAKRPPILLK